jgi:antitoxin CptB
MTEADKIRWQCRRGMLELDLILERFNQHHLDGLEPGQLQCLQELLAFSDKDLLDLVMGRAAAPDRRYDYVLRLLRAP